jgi:hypothetical protein
MQTNTDYHYIPLDIYLDGFLTSCFSWAVVGNLLELGTGRVVLFAFLGTVSLVFFVFYVHNFFRTCQDGSGSQRVELSCNEQDSQRTGRHLDNADELTIVELYCQRISYMMNCFFVPFNVSLPF